jgi:uncharacterized protein with PIN domain
MCLHIFINNINDYNNAKNFHDIKNIKRKRCFRCDDRINTTNNGMVINEGLSTEMFLCNDCHFIEFGINIDKKLLIF